MVYENPPSPLNTLLLPYGRPYHGHSWPNLNLLITALCTGIARKSNEQGYKKIDFFFFSASYIFISAMTININNDSYHPTFVRFTHQMFSIVTSSLPAARTAAGSETAPAGWPPPAAAATAAAASAAASGRRKRRWWPPLPRRPPPLPAAVAPGPAGAPSGACPPVAG